MGVWGFAVALGLYRGTVLDRCLGFELLFIGVCYGLGAGSLVSGYRGGWWLWLPESLSIFDVFLRLTLWNVENRKQKSGKLKIRNGKWKIGNTKQVNWEVEDAAKKWKNGGARQEMKNGKWQSRTGRMENKQWKWKIGKAGKGI
ncbi:hypothetical protein WN48_01992 [Eufriesea mexicana]|nr:hypothetical protein WN48_01992 [Eufriesea mexicana]